MIAFFAAVIVYHATVLKVIDGDTLKVHIARWPAPFDPIDVRVVGVDAPEHVMPPAQAICEVALGQQAASFAKGLVAHGQGVVIRYTRGVNDKYGRLLGSVTLPDGRDWGGVMIAGHFGRPYGQAGDLHKAPWC